MSPDHEYPVEQQVFESRFERYKTDIENTLELCDWDTKTDNITHNGFKHLAKNARQLAAYHLVRGERETAIDLYRKGAITYHTSAVSRTPDDDLKGEVYDTPRVYAYSILLALLADEWHLAEEHAKATLEMPTKWPTSNPENDELKDLPHKGVAYGRAIAAVVLDDRGRARKFLEDLRSPVPPEYQGSHVYDNETRKPLYETHSDALEGILDEDPEAVADALDRYIEEVYEDGWKWASEVEWATNAFRATGLLNLARKKGLAVEFESEYVPEELIHY